MKDVAKCRPRRLLRIAAALILGNLPALASAQVDRIFTSGRVITMNEAQPVAEAFATGDGLIVAVGSSAEIRRAYPNAEESDLGGKDVMPGIIESHGHMLNLGRIATRVDLQGIDEPADVVARLRERVAKTRCGEWIEGWGWDDGAWKEHLATIREELNAASPDNPVWFAGLHGFSGWANELALNAAGISRETPDPPNGKIYRDAGGVPTGVLANSAQELVTGCMPPLTLEQRTAAYESAAAELLRHGLTSVHDARLSRDDIQALRALKAQDRLGVRYYGMIDGADNELVKSYLQSGPEVDPDHWLTVRCIKVFQDGSLGTRSALLLRTYSDAPDVLGIETTPREDLQRLTTRALQAGMQVATHAIGDRSNRVTLDAYHAALQAVPAAVDHRLRIEHAQVVDAEDIPRFRDLGIIASMQPPHATSDMPWAEDRLGPERVKLAYAWRAFVDAGVRVPLSSDFPGETLNPFYGMYAAETRQTAAGEPAGGWYPQQCLSRQEVLRAYTLHAAYSAFEDAIKGKLAPGMLADFIVLSEPIETIPPVRLLSLRVEQAYVGGELAYDSRSGR